MFTILYNHHHHPSPEPSQRETVPIKQLCPILPSPQSLIATSLPSASVNVTTLGTSFKWNRIAFALLCLASFTWHVFKVHPHYSMAQYFISSYGWIILHCIDIPRCVYLLSLPSLKKSFLFHFYCIYSHWLEISGPCHGPFQAIKLISCNRELGLNGNIIMAKELKWKGLPQKHCLLLGAEKS